jgi:type VI secretion system secreted protein VgrG
MPDNYTQKNSPMRFRAEAIGEDDLLITHLTGSEALSELYEFDLDLIASLDKPVAFADVLGKAAAVALDVSGGDPRYFQGLIVRFAQGVRDDTILTYRATLVPPVWLLTKRVQSRIFQHVSVPDILKTVFAGFKVTYKIQGSFYARDYCVQYRESDFAFASRLMEEEGLYYYFRHTDTACEMVIANTPQGHDKIPAPTTLIYDEVQGGEQEEGRVTAWQKVQEVRSGQVTLWDHCFELPDKNLEAGQKLQDSVTVGQVNHTLKLPVSDALEQYDYPGGYADRFDGIDPGGAPQPAEIQKIFEDNRRTARLRIQEEASGALSIEGTSSGRQLTSGQTFTLDRHFDADGDYVLTRNWFELSEYIPVHPIGTSLSPCPQHAQTDDPGNANSGCGWPPGGRDFHGQVRADQGSVPLGPTGEIRCRQFVLDSRCHDLGRERLGGCSHSEDWAGSGCRFPGRRPRSADRDRERL